MLEEISCRLKDSTKKFQCLTSLTNIGYINKVYNTEMESILSATYKNNYIHAGFMPVKFSCRPEIYQSVKY